MVALTGLFGPSFVLFGVLQGHNKPGGKQGKQQATQLSQRAPKQTTQSPKFHHCSSPGVVRTSQARDSHSQCFQCLSSPVHAPGPCLTSGPAAQECHVMRLCFWYLKPQSRCPLPVNTVDAGITRLAFYLGSIDQASYLISPSFHSSFSTGPYSGYFVFLDSVGLSTSDDSLAHPR